MNPEEFYLCPKCSKRINRNAIGYYSCPYCGEVLYKPRRPGESYYKYQISREEEFERKAEEIDKRIIETLWTILLSGAVSAIVALVATR